MSLRDSSSSFSSPRLVDISGNSYGSWSGAKQLNGSSFTKDDEIHFDLLTGRELPRVETLIIFPKGEEKKNDERLHWDNKGVERILKRD